MALKLYRRHRTECEAGRSEDSRSGEFEEGWRGWRRCACLIHVSGTLGGKFNRRNTGKSDWDEARAVVSVWNSAGNWDGEVPSPPPPTLDDDAPARITVDRAISVFLAEHSAAVNTQKKYRLLLNKLKAHSESRGYVLIEQWSPLDVREFRASWKVSPITASKNLTLIKSFFEFAVSNEWIARNPARLVKEARGQILAKERVPFSDDELERMFEACETQYGKTPVRWSRQTHHRPATGAETVNYKYKWTGQDLADFIAVSVYTGLRISDVTTFHIDRLLKTGECHIRTTKNGRKVFTWIPEWLQERISRRAEDHGPLIFGGHTTKDMNVITDVWRRKLKRLWDLCGPWPEKPTPHRFRHTFARILLQRANVTVRDVAELLGDTEDIVRKHYAAWVPERQARLTKVLKEAFNDKPRPKLVAIGGGRT
jgi:integrase